MNDEKELTVFNGTIRKIIGAAIYDLAVYVSSTNEPFIIGGQYPNKMLLDVIRMWCFDRKLDLDHPDKATEAWLSLCNRGLLAGDKKFDRPPKPVTPPPKPPIPPLKPPSGDQYKDYKDRGQDDSPAGGAPRERDSGEDWKPKDQRKDRWQNEGEDWKKESDDETS